MNFKSASAIRKENAAALDLQLKYDICELCKMISRYLKALFSWIIYYVFGHDRI